MKSGTTAAKACGLPQASVPSLSCTTFSSASIRKVQSKIDLIPEISHTGVDDLFFKINKDDSVGEVICYAFGNNIEGRLYVKHNVKDINNKVIELDSIDLTKENDVECEAKESDDDARKVRLDDSEDERITALDDGFEVIEVDRPKEGATIIEINGKSYRFKMYASKPLIKKSNLKKKLKLIAPPRLVKDHKTKDSQRMAGGDDQYESDELGSSDSYSSEDEKMVRYKKFRKKQLDGVYAFATDTRHAYGDPATDNQPADDDHGNETQPDVDGDDIFYNEFGT
ncbi:hypothetical protein KIW84_072545 [Lathyrus oleraceus]|uniref:Uncharacterized protein n=1 Tax=Pisum sativum TaxID=3888 RepID=A0A9D4ZUH3_PEA|nr:hypothetical protein KIW84_072545 [Pisum sativum]